jgi:hypothetical protein
MAVQFLLFMMAVLLLMIFWELTKINSRLKKVFPPAAVVNEPDKAKQP